MSLKLVEVEVALKGDGDKVGLLDQITSVEFI